MNPADALSEAMLHFGRDELLPSTEAAEGSAWVDDNTRVPAPGYYERRRVPLEHRVLRDGKIAVFEWKKESVSYRIQIGCEPSYERNLEAILDVFKTLLSWISRGIATWDEAFAGFQRTSASGEWWRILRLPPDATREEIETAFRSQVRKAHPDVGGTHDAFIQLRAAYEQALESINGA